MRRCEPGKRNSSRAGSRQNFELRISDCEIRSKESGDRSQNSNTPALQHSMGRIIGTVLHMRLSSNDTYSRLVKREVLYNGR